MTLTTKEWLLVGLDGGNLLAFLAALGALRTTTLAWPSAEVRMRWVAVHGGWHPVLSVACQIDKATFLVSMDGQLQKMRNHPALAIGDDLNYTVEAFRKFCIQAQSSVDIPLTSSIFADFLACFASDGITEEKKDQVADTAFRTMRGAGHQHFVKTMRDLADSTTKDHLEKCLFHAWGYDDVGLTLRFDPMDDRRYALRWKEPSKDPGKTMQGANRLAIEALPLFPVQPVGNKLKTTGFTSRPRQGTFFRWPIWEGDLTVDVVRSILGLAELQGGESSRQKLRQKGIVEIFQSQRITLGKYRNFSTATPL